MATPEEWDAAISFVDGDIASARRIVDLLKDRASVFLYANHQDQLVGSDGVVTLSNVYGRRARLVVVLYRATWGNTDWTSIERSAINSRRLNDRTDEFLTVVKMEDVATPTWLPTARIYGRWEPLGAEGVAGAIVTRLQELGTHVRPETAADLARRMAAEQEWKDHREKYLNEKGWDAGAAQVVMAFDALERLAAEADCKFLRDRDTATVMRSGFFAILARSQTNRGRVQIVMTVWRGELWSRTTPMGKTLEVQKFTFDISPPDVLGWKGDTAFVSSEKLAEIAVTRLLRQVQYDISTNG